MHAPSAAFAPQGSGHKPPSTRTRRAEQQQKLDKQRAAERAAHDTDDGADPNAERNATEELEQLVAARPVDVGAMTARLQQALDADPVDEGAVEQALTALEGADMTLATLKATGGRTIHAP